MIHAHSRVDHAPPLRSLLPEPSSSEWRDAAESTPSVRKKGDASPAPAHFRREDDGRVLSEPAALCFLQNQHGLISPPALLHGEESPAVDQLGSIAGVVVSHKGVDQESAAAMAVAGAGSVVKEIILTASSMMFSLQQIALGAGGYRDKLFADEPGKLSPAASEIVELDAADLLAKYTHHCHPTAEEYKTRAALAQPRRRLQWNMKHPKFQPLRGATAQDDICNRCNRKKFAVSFRPPDPREALQPPPVAVLLRDVLLRKDKLVGSPRPLPGPRCRRRLPLRPGLPPEIRVEVTRNACWN
ncbi:unnamed protein product [Spirodela intermedia]|uniref:Uncharacterized protein n=1 Tax=Spirodela intermedia TaxID=51605 RepID=A0A7I8IYE3_SPIIN|nr:unnamed protein product [Spirodela intermedia]CAA6662593.1 unnamed protein product [Spirodela intermedia]